MRVIVVGGINQSINILDEMILATTTKKKSEKTPKKPDLPTGL